jgi:integrase/recombinase XerD
LIQHNNINTLLDYAAEKLKKKFSYFVNTGQVRASTITHWTAQHDIMTVKYMAGHRWVSSTEWYNMASVEELKQKILRVHPMG